MTAENGQVLTLILTLVPQHTKIKKKKRGERQMKHTQHNHSGSLFGPLPKDTSVYPRESQMPAFKSDTG